MPKISIITINQNNEVGLKKTIESVIAQKFTDFEYIIIDGASTDGSVEVINQHSNKLAYWVSEPDSGIYNAMNKGIAKANGEYCLFLNSGDWLNNNVLEKVAPQLNNKIDILYGNLYILDNNGRISETFFPDSIRFSYLFENYIPHPASFINTSLFKKIGFYNENYKICSDWDFFLKAIAIQNCTTQHIPLFVTYFINDGISALNYDTIIKLERNKIMRELFPLFYQDYEEFQKFKTSNNRLVRFAINISKNRFFVLWDHYFKKIFGQ
jgi:glycosyltransferase involved in cell wall biosynthesis